MSGNDPRRFMFFESYWDGLKQLDNDSMAALLRAMCEYAFEGREPELDISLSCPWSFVKPNIDSSLKRIENAKKGGRPKKEADGHIRKEGEGIEEKRKGIVSTTEKTTVKTMVSDKERDCQRLCPRCMSSNIAIGNSGMAHCNHCGEDMRDFELVMQR